jgi:hypothetical protein
MYYVSDDDGSEIESYQRFTTKITIVPKSKKIKGFFLGIYNEACFRRRALHVPNLAN